MKTARIVLVMLVLVTFVCAALAAAKAPRGMKAAPGAGGVKPQWWGKPPGERPTVKGTVANVSQTSIAVQTEQGLKSFVVNEKTKVIVRGQKATIGDVKVGDLVGVKFLLQQDNVPLAQIIIVPKPTFAGVITALEGNVFTLKGKDGATRRVVVTPETKFTSHGYVGKISDLRIGYKASASGDIVGEELNAVRVDFVPVVAKGTVTAVEGNLITVKTVRQLVIQCEAGPGTAILIRPRVGPNQKGTIADIKVGMPCNIGFHAKEPGPVPLLWIDLLTGM